MVAMEKARKGFYLIWAQFVFWVQVFRDTIRDFLFHTVPLGKRIELFVEELFGHRVTPPPSTRVPTGRLPTSTVKHGPPKQLYGARKAILVTLLCLIGQARFFRDLAF